MSWPLRNGTNSPNYKGPNRIYFSRCGKFIIIILTRGKTTVIDARDYDKVKDIRWYACKVKRVFYAVSSTDKLKMHKIILGIKGNEKADHKNHDGLDNRRSSNLRIAMNNQNNWNKRKTINPTTSIFKGVHWDKRRKKWCSQIQVNRKRIYLGCFDSEKIAAKVYDTAALKYFGEFAVFNLKGEMG